MVWAEWIWAIHQIILILCTRAIHLVYNIYVVYTLFNLKICNDLVVEDAFLVETTLHCFSFTRCLSYFPRVESGMLGYFRLSQETDNQTKVFVVVSKKKEEVSVLTWHFLTWVERDLPFVPEMYIKTTWANPSSAVWYPALPTTLSLLIGVSGNCTAISAFPFSFLFKCFCFHFCYVPQVSNRHAVVKVPLLVVWIIL